MAVDIEEIKNIYDGLNTKVKDTLTSLLKEYAITEKERAQDISSVVSTLIPVSVQAGLDEPVKSAEKEMIVEQKNVEIEKKE